MLSENNNKTNIKKVHTDDEMRNHLERKFSNEIFKLRNEEKITVFITAPYMMPNIVVFKEFFETRGFNVLLPDDIDFGKERLEEKDLMKYIGQYEIALIGDDRYTRKVMSNDGKDDNKMKKKLIGLMKWGTGIDSIDLIAAKELGVIIKNTENAFSEPVAESILGSILSFNRGLLTSTIMMQKLKTDTNTISENDNHNWIKVPGKTISETSFGIIGVGNVGKTLIKKLLLLGAENIKTYDIIVSDSEDHEDFFLKRMSSLNELLDSEPDFLIICCSQTASNIKMISESELNRLKKGNTVLINMARGSLIDEEALIKSLKEGGLRGAALDVFWHEPLPSDSELRRLPNLILTSHNANSSPYYWLQVHLNTINNAFTTLCMKEPFS